MMMIIIIIIIIINAVIGKRQIIVEKYSQIFEVGYLQVIKKTELP
jgi:hypothetical protein